MRESAEIEKVIRQYIGALKAEATELKGADTKRTPLYNGVLLRKGDDGYIYRFETEIELFLCEGTPVSVYTEGKTVFGAVMDASGFDLILILPTEVSPLGVEMSSSPWYLLEDLSAHLEKLIKSSYETELYADLIEKRKVGLSSAPVQTGQDRAFQAATLRPITFLWGPPGTGKTYTLAEIAYAFYKKGVSTLILSQSNVAVDCALLELSKYLKREDEGKVLRYGSYRKKEIAEASIVLSSYDLALKHNPELVKQREQLTLRKSQATFEQAAQIEQELAALKEGVHEKEQALVYEAKIVGATLSKAVVAEVISRRKFGAVLVDEASMCFVPQIIYAASLATSHFVVVGDFRQLPPIVTSLEAKPLLTKDVFHFLGIPRGKEVNFHPWLVMLDNQRRMHPEIASFVSQEVYGGLLKTEESVLYKREELSLLPPFPSAATRMLDLTDTYNVCVKTADGSRFNVLSAMLTASLAAQAAKQGVKIAVVTPYVSQVRLIRAILTDLGLLGEIAVSSVHQFQGSETDVVLFDTVDFLRQNKPGYLLYQETEEDDVALRLINVAMTRARGKFVLVTNARYFGGKLPQNSTLKNLIATLAQKDRVSSPESTSFPLADNPLTDASLLVEGEESTSAADDVDEATSTVDLFLPNATFSEHCAAVLSNSLQRAKRRGVRVRVYAENPALTSAYFPEAQTERSATLPLLFIDGKTVRYNPLFCKEWKNMSQKWQSRLPVSVRAVGVKTVETLQALLLSYQKAQGELKKAALFGMKEDAAAEEETTGREIYTCICYLNGMTTDRGADDYFALIKALKKRFAFRFVKTRLGAECCFKKREIWKSFLLGDVCYNLQIAAKSLSSYEELLTAAKAHFEHNNEK